MGPLMAKDTEERIAGWKPVYSDVEVELTHDIRDGQKPSELTLRMTGDVKLCYFSMR